MMLLQAWRKVLFIVVLLISLQGCVAFVGGAAVGAAGAVAVFDRRNIKNIFIDNEMSKSISAKLQENQEVTSQCHVVVTTYRKTVLLVGQAPTQELKQEIARIAMKVSGIRHLYNQITLQGPTSNLTRTSDAWITTKVKAALLGTSNLQSGQFKVLTENGTVFLMGVVSHDQAKLAVSVAREVNGVQKVVKVFSYTRDPAGFEEADNEAKDAHDDSSLEDEVQ